MHLKSYIIGILAFWALSANAQTEQNKQTLDLFCGVGFSYSDTNWHRLFDVLLELTPGFKWNMGHDWQVAGQVLIPVVNDYGDRYRRVRPNMAVLSKQLHLWDSQHFKLSGGLFSQERYGFDLKWMFPATKWLAFDAQVGYTGYLSMADGYNCERLKRVTYLGGVNVFLSKWNTEFRAHGGKYIYGDYAFVGEVMRHYKYCTVGLYGQLQEKSSRYGKNSNSHTNGGFKFVWMLPPYKKSKKSIRIRPATNFRHVYNVHSDQYWVKQYKTDPEENEREGNFNPNEVRWGANTIGIGGDYGQAK